MDINRDYLGEIYTEIERMREGGRQPSLIKLSPPTKQIIIWELQAKGYPIDKLEGVSEGTCYGIPWEEDNELHQPWGIL